MAKQLAPCRAVLQALTLFLSLTCLLPVCAVQAAPPPLPTELAAPSEPFLPYSEYLFDPSGSMDISEAASPQQEQAYRPLNLRELPRGNGALWLRFRLAPVSPGQHPGIFLLDMGQSLPGVPVLFEPEYNPLSGSMEWRDSAPARRNILLLPEPGAESLVCHIRLDGLPGLWFAPMLRTPHDAATDLYSMAYWAALLALGVVMLLCILRGLAERGQWRIWTACYVAAALGQGLCGMPATGSGQLSLPELPEVLLPGMALMLLPHVGRHLLQTPLRSRALDVQLVLLSLPGAVLALLPLVPGYGWLNRYLDLWPAATLLFVPTALGAWLMGLAGGKRFLLGCLLPPLFVAGGIVGLESSLPASVLASLPLWGVALSAILLAATRAPADRSGAEESSKSTASAQADSAALGTADADEVIALDQPLEEAQAHPMNDPALRLIPAAPLTPSRATTGQEELSPAFWEAALQEPLDNILQNGAALERCSLPPAVRSHAEGMVRAARHLANIIAAPEKAREGGGTEPSGAFNLQYLMRDVHDAVAPAAENAGIGLAWYMPPQMGQMYEGAAASLGAALRLLLESAVQATQQGAVHFSVRPRPESSDPGDLLFTITDSGAGLPPQGRSMLGLARAWEMAGLHGGSLGLEYGPKGATIAFSVRLRSLDQESAQPGAETNGPEAVAAAQHTALPLLVLVAPQPTLCETVAAMLADLPCRCEHFSSLAEAVPALTDFVPLCIVRGPEADVAARPWLKRLESHNAACSSLPGKVLAITPDDSQWSLLADAGFTHALLEPVDEADLRQTVCDVLAAVAVAEVEAEKNAGRGRASAGRPPLPDLFGPSEDAPGPLQMPDLTALPDLMRFAEELHASGKPRVGAEAAPIASPVPSVLTLKPEEHDATSPTPQLSEQEQPPLVASAGLEGPLWLDEPAPVQPPDTEQASDKGQAAPLKSEDLAAQAQPQVTEATDSAKANEPMPASAPELSHESADFAAVAAAPSVAPNVVADTSCAVDSAAVATDAPEPERPDRPTDEAQTAETAAMVAPAESVPPFLPETALSQAGVRPIGEMPARQADAVRLEARAEAAQPQPFQQTDPQWADPQEADRQLAGTPLAESLGATIVPVRAPQPGASRPAHPADGLLEWVGEPMPIAAGQPRASAAVAENPQPRQPAVAQRPAAAVRQSAPRAQTFSYTSPSLRVPGEWVGEPMPIVRPQPQPEAQAMPAASPKPSQRENLSSGEQPAPAAPASASTSAPASAPNSAPSVGGNPLAGSNSLMDFILGATPVRKEQPPLPSLIGEVPQSSPLPAAEAQAAASPVENILPPRPEADSLPVFPGPDKAIAELVGRLDAAMDEAQTAFRGRRAYLVGGAAGRIAADADAFGLRALARMARCVESAAKANDMMALGDLLPELAVAVERNRITLSPRK